jgi:hypothetical protein
MVSAGCASVDDPVATTDDDLTLSSTVVTLGAGEERHLCWSIPIPEEGYTLAGIDFVVPGGIHHYQVTAQPYEPEQDQPYDCGGMGGPPAGGEGAEDDGPQGEGDAPGGFASMLALGGPGTEPTMRFPEGTAAVLESGTHLVLQLHVLNPSSEAIELPAAHAKLRRSTLAREDLQQVGILLVNDGEIQIPPASTGVQEGFDCVLPEKLENVFNVWPHMHRLGEHIAVDIAGARVVDTAWDVEHQRLYAVDLGADVGQSIAVSCIYDNPGSETVTFGERTSNEMCSAFVYYYPRVDFGFCE